MRLTPLALVLLLTAVGAATAVAQEEAPDHEAMIATALRAAPASISEHAAVMDWQGNTLKQGTNGWTCFPNPPGTQANSMCLNEPWMQWAQGWMNNEPVEIDRAGIAYMLLGDAGASNTDPFAEGPTPDNHWVESGPHLMFIVPDPAALEGIPTDPDNGGPWVMWKGTPYAHIMVPVPGHM